MTTATMMPADELTRFHALRSMRFISVTQAREAYDLMRKHPDLQKYTIAKELLDDDDCFCLDCAFEGEWWEVYTDKVGGFRCPTCGSTNMHGLLTSYHLKDEGQEWFEECLLDPRDTDALFAIWDC